MENTACFFKLSHKREH
jgi:hypothetical protein